MGRGGGCVPGKLAVGKKKSNYEDPAPATKDLTLVDDREGELPACTLNSTSQKLKIFVVVLERGVFCFFPSGTYLASIYVPVAAVKLLKNAFTYYSTYGHVATLARKVKEGADSVEGYLYQVPETLSHDTLWQMKAPIKDSTVPVISADEMTEADAIIFGFPTRYGSMAVQMKAFFDSTGPLGRGQLLAGKPAGFFVSTGTQGGGQETTAWTAITQLAHHGMLFVPIGYTFGAAMFKLDEIRGG